MKTFRITVLLAWSALPHHDVFAWTKPPSRHVINHGSSGGTVRASKRRNDNVHFSIVRKGRDGDCISRNEIMKRFGMLAVAITQRPRVSDAACLPGDTSPDCIGVYKMPIDDEARKYVDTPEKFKTYAPDVRWVPQVEYPKTYKDASEELQHLQDTSLPSVKDFVLKGDLTKAGTLLLEVIPRVTTAGTVVVRSLENSSINKEDGTRNQALSMKASRAQMAHQDLLSKLGETDVMIGQAIAGAMGAPAPAQIQILAELKEAKVFFDDFVRYL